MKKLLIVLCTLVSVLSFADNKILQAPLLPDMSFYYECNLQALNAVPGLEEKLEKMDNAPLGDALKINEATEKMVKALGLDPKKDVLKMNCVATLTPEQIANLQKGADSDKWTFCGAVETAKAIDVAAAPEAITTYMSEIGGGSTSTPFKVGEMTGLKLKMPPSKKARLHRIDLHLRGGLAFQIVLDVRKHLEKQ